MAAGAKIVEGMRRSSLTANEIDLFKQSFVLVPYQPSGYLNITNLGFNNNNVDVNSFETFKRLWTGNDAFNIQWKGSIVCHQDEKTKEGVIEFKLGEVILGVMETNSNESQINQDESFSQYKAQQSKSTLTFRVSNYFNINDNYQFLFWKIPEISGSTLYRVSNIEKDYIGLELVGYVLTLESLNQELANTGRARQQNVMPNAPGQGYLECIVKDSSWPSTMTPEEWAKLIEGKDYYKLFNRYITTDFQKRLSRPCRYVNVKFFGNAIPLSISFAGRETISGLDFTQFGTPCTIFPMNFRNPDTPNLFNTQQNETNCYFGTFSPTILYWKEWNDAVKDWFLNTNNQWTFNGFLEYDYASLSSTNPLEDGKYKYNLFGYVETSTTESVVKPWYFVTPNKDIDTSSIEGCKSKYKIGGYKIIHDHMFDNYWTQKNMSTLPISAKNSFNFGNTVSSLLLKNTFSITGARRIESGAAITWTFAALQLALIGVSYIYNKIINRIEFQTLRGIISSAFLDLNNDQWQKVSAGGNKIEMSILNGDITSPTSIFFPTQTMSIGINAELTNSFVDSEYQNVVFRTYNIGQTKFADGTNIIDGKRPYTLGGTTTLIETGYGFIIDKITIGAIFKGEISIEFLDENEEVIWTGIYQSEGKWTDSVKEIWTEKITSTFGRENLFFSEPVPYPEPIPPLEGGILDAPILESVWNITSQTYNSNRTSPSFVGLYNQGILDVLNLDKAYYVTKTAMKTSDIIPKEHTHVISLIKYNNKIRNFEDFKYVYQNMSFKLKYYVGWYGMWSFTYYPPPLGPSIVQVPDGNHEVVKEGELILDSNVELNKSGTTGISYQGRNSVLISLVTMYGCGDANLREFRYQFTESADGNELFLTLNCTQFDNPHCNIGTIPNYCDFCGLASYQMESKILTYDYFSETGGFLCGIEMSMNATPKK